MKVRKGQEQADWGKMRLLKLKNIIILRKNSTSGLKNHIVYYVSLYI